MGVSGSGKTTVATTVAQRLGWQFAEGDALHPVLNIEKMKAGRPLTDADRQEWLAGISKWVDQRLERGENGVITCSALKRAYRDEINRRGTGVVFVFLAGGKETTRARLAARLGHFMPASLVDSQFDELEEPAPDEPVIRVDVGPAPSVISERVLRELGLGD